LDIPILNKDLIQCADAVIKLRAEYFYKDKQYNNISFTLTNGMRVPFSKYANGYRIKIIGNNTEWVLTSEIGHSRNIFEKYLEAVYIYAGTISLSKELIPVKINDIEIGDVFIQKGSPGHVVMVIDLAENKQTGRKVMLLAQSYMPSQEIHILKSYEKISPWYTIDNSELRTPEWIFIKDSLKRFKKYGAGVSQ
jgi:hypothetical protein